ncbi:velvet factor-domain-containing protein [Parasitella parasitica]|nr:velvet factor-domain-containing protein [Parasitella parasitica]
MSLSSNNSSGCTYRFIESSLSTLPVQTNYQLEIRQQPKRAKVSLINERDRRPIEPPPILQLYWKNCSEEELKKCLQSPFYFTVANLVTENDPDTPLLPVQEYMSGSTVSSLHRLRDIDNLDGGFFVFGDLAVKKDGKFKLKFSLFEIAEGQVENKRTILSDAFTVFIPKQFPGPVEATFLSRTFSDQGVKMRIRKEHQLQSRKRKHENETDSSFTPPVTNEPNVQPTKRYYTKHSKTIASSPTYADPSASSSDVFFGRWQATTPHQIKNLSCSLATPPILTNTGKTTLPEDSEYRRMACKFKYQYPEDHAQAFPSPESTIYNATLNITSNSSTPRSASWGYRYNERDAHSRSLPPIINETNARRSSPEMITTAGLFTDSPPSMAKQLPQDPSLARYHTCYDTKSYHRDSSSLDDLPTPPSSIIELHQNATGTQNWGTRLPPLKAIMDNLDPHMNKSSLFPLLLPPPPSLVAVNTNIHEKNNYSKYR